MYTYRLNRIVFNDGSEIIPGNMTVIIGPNNAGKSRALKDIAGKTTQETPFPGIVVTDVEWLSPSSLQELREAYSIERYQDENYQWIFRTLGPDLCHENLSSLSGIDWPTEYEQNFEMLMKRLYKASSIQNPA